MNEELDDYVIDDYGLIMIMTVTMMIKMKCLDYAAAQDCVTIRQDISFSAWKTGGRSNLKLLAGALSDEHITG